MLWQLAARGMKVSTAAAAAANAAEAVAASSTPHSPPPDSDPPQQEPAAKAPVLPVPQIQTNSAVSMTAALKHVGAVSIYFQSSKHQLGLFLILTSYWILCFADHSDEGELARFRKSHHPSGEHTAGRQHSRSGYNPNPGTGRRGFNSQTVILGPS